MWNKITACIIPQISFIIIMTFQGSGKGKKRPCPHTRFNPSHHKWKDFDLRSLQ